MGENKRLTRRQLLAQLAGAGAVVWASPMLTSIQANASSAINPCKGKYWLCEYQPQACCGGSGICFQKVNAKGDHGPDRLGCIGPQDGMGCQDFQTCTRGGTHSCPEGYGCFSTCCDQYFGYGYLCMKKCHTRSNGPRKAIPQPSPGVPTVFGRG